MEVIGPQGQQAKGASLHSLVVTTALSLEGETSVLITDSWIVNAFSLDNH